MTTLSVSITPHLRTSLKDVGGLISDPINKIIEETADATQIEYNTLVDVSKWARTEEGIKALKEKTLDPNDYSLISLLAGTTANPSSRLPPPEQKPEPWEIAQEEKTQNRAIAALVNGLFSVVGVGVAAWWASKNTGWKDEWRLLLALASALIVGIAEGGLYAIYHNRREQSKKFREERRRKRALTLKARHEQRQKRGVQETVEDSINIDNRGEETEEDVSQLRRRNVVDAPDES